MTLAIDQQGVPGGGVREASLRRSAGAAGIPTRATLRRKVIGAVAVVTSLVLAVASVVVILNARNATRIEVERALDGAERLVREAAARLSSADGGEESFLKALARDAGSARHVGISVIDAAGRSVPVGSSPRDDDDEDEHDWGPAPDWFVALIAPETTVRRVAVGAPGRPVGAVLMTGRAEDEIAEVWADFVALGLVGAGGAIALVVILGVVLGRILRPIADLGEALGALERSDYAVRLDESPVAEIDAVVMRFNGLAAALSDAEAANRRLARRLVTVQDEERRRLAMDLHDEFGPCLFGIKANAASIRMAAEASAGAGAERTAACADEILAIAEKLQIINRTILRSLRPMSLGEVPLDEILDDLAVGLRRGSPGLDLELEIRPEGRSFGESIDLTIYRCIQEAVVNAVKHGGAKRVLVRVLADDADLRLEIRDDGTGISAGAGPSYGLTGMRDRVLALRGAIEIGTAEGGGVAIAIRIPIEGAARENGGRA